MHKHINQNKVTKPVEPQRFFLGKMDVELDRSSEINLLRSKAERSHNQKMLKAYLKGHEFFGATIYPKLDPKKLQFPYKPYRVLQHRVAN